MTVAPTRIETPDPLAALFLDMGIETITYAHPPVFTVEEGRAYKDKIPGGHTKNLFLKDKKGLLWLIVALDETAVDLKSLPRRIKSDRLSFARPERLLEALGVTPGSVTPFSLISDTARRVTPVLDAALLDCDVLNFHPLRNDKTTSIKPKDLLRFMEHLGYIPHIVDFREI